MTKMDYSRRPGRLSSPSDLPDATPWTPAQRRAWITKKRQQRRQHEIVNQDPEIKHAQHPASVRWFNGSCHVWCMRCDCSVHAMTAVEYEIWREKNPKKLRKISDK